MWTSDRWHRPFMQQLPNVDRKGSPMPTQWLIFPRASMLHNKQGCGTTALLCLSTNSARRQWSCIKFWMGHRYSSSVPINIVNYQHHQQLWPLCPTLLQHFVGLISIAIVVPSCQQMTTTTACHHTCTKSQSSFAIRDSRSPGCQHGHQHCEECNGSYFQSSNPDTTRCYFTRLLCSIQQGCIL